MSSVDIHFCHFCPLKSGDLHVRSLKTFPSLHWRPSLLSTGHWFFPPSQAVGFDQCKEASLHFRRPVCLTETSFHLFYTIYKVATFKLLRFRRPVCLTETSFHLFYTIYKVATVKLLRFRRPVCLTETSFHLFYTIYKVATVKLLRSTRQSFTPLTNQPLIHAIRSSVSLLLLSFSGTGDLLACQPKHVKLSR